tara:strand:+ start:575 stop:958 length:384 start_codon:yes stop_codon:yes gene_type:complete
MGFLKIHVLRRTKMEIVILVLSLALVITVIWISRMSRELKQEQFRNRSLSSKYGKLTEQFLPLIDSYPWNSQKFRFLGSPIDGVQFEDDKVIFVEFKTGNSQLSKNQRHIRDIVEANKVEFQIIKIK